MNLTEQIEDTLVFTHGFDSGSAITRAVAYVLFNRHSSTLVNHSATLEAMACAITDDMIAQAAAYITRQLQHRIQAKVITDLHSLNPEDRITIINRQFNTTTPAIFLKHDPTNLNRSIGYACFDRGRGREPEFAVWQHELDRGDTIITRP